MKLIDVPAGAYFVIPEHEHVIWKKHYNGLDRTPWISHHHLLPRAAHPDVEVTLISSSASTHVQSPEAGSSASAPLS